MERLTEEAQADFEVRNAARDEVLNMSRELIRLCSHAIRAGHRKNRTEAYATLAEADQVVVAMRTLLTPYPDLFHAGYTQDALKEWIEARLTLALVGNEPMPAIDPEIPYATYLNGLCEAASELRRRCLDCMRHGEMDEAERLLAAMDAAYEVLMSFSFPDAITGGLRRRVDQLRAVLERTRGDLTNSLQIQRLLQALESEAA
ncbi:MAG: haloacid dehalogenase [Anaerolineae bacterium]|nr:haloacid dehalogenase [Anaerolineae bacterium]